MGNAAHPFETLVQELDYPLFLVTAAAGAEVDGCVVGFASQCSIAPERFIACLSKQNRTTQLAHQADLLVVHVLHETDRAIAIRFGSTTGDEVDKLGGCEWSAGPGGAPVLTGLDWFVGSVIDRHDIGDHIAYVLEIEPEGSATRAHEPHLGYAALRELPPGHEP